MDRTRVGAANGGALIESPGPTVEEQLASVFPREAVEQGLAEQHKRLIVAVLSGEVALDAEPRAALAFFECLDDEQQDSLVSTLTTTRENDEIVARNYAKLAELTNIEDPERLLRFVGFVRQSLTERDCDQMNEAEGRMGGGGNWIVCRGAVVVEGSPTHRSILRERERASRLRVAAVVRPVIRVCSHGRRRRSRSAGSRLHRRTRSPGSRRSEDPASDRLVCRRREVAR